MLKYVNYDIVFQEFPDEVSLCINLSGCPHRCKGCHSAFLQRNIGEELTELVLQELIVGNEGITCVGFMGGDNDIDTLFHLAGFVQKNFSYLKIGWYSGNNALPKHLPISLFNYIKIGEYNSLLGPLNSLTTNQRFYVLNSKGEYIDKTSVFWR